MSPQPHNDDAKGLVLSPADIDRLLNDSSSESRVDITHKIGGNYNHDGLSKTETVAAEQIFRLLLKDTEVKVRASLAGYVKDSKSIPSDIVLSMVRDVEEVSLPVIQFSEVLTDEDLLELVNSTQEVSRYLAISKRKTVSPLVSDVLIDKGDESVRKTLVNNDGANLSEDGMGKIIELHKNDEAMMKTLAERSKLPVKVVDKLVNVVSASLSETLKKKYHRSSENIDAQVEKAQEKETLDLVLIAQSDAEIEKLVAQLAAFKRLTPSMVLSALCQGNFGFFEAAIAKLANLPTNNARKLIHDRGDLGFRAIYNKSGLPSALFPAVKLLLNVVRQIAEEGEKPGTPKFANRVVEQILKHSEEEPMDNLSYIIALVRRVSQ